MMIALFLNSVTLNFKNNINISVTLIIFIYQNGRKDYNIFAVSSWFSFCYEYYMTYNSLHINAIK